MSLSGSAATSVAIALPACGNVQVDIYYAPLLPAIDAHHTIGSKLLGGALWHRSDCVVDPGYAPDPQSIVATVPAGTLVISTPYTPKNPLVLPDLTLAADARSSTTSAPFDAIVVTDTRPGAPQGWALSARSSDLASPDGVIDAGNVGLTDLTEDPVSVDPAPGNVTTYDNPTPAVPVGPGGGGTAGLGGGTHTVATAERGRGTTRLSGTLTVVAPTSSLLGTYLGTITFTVI